MKRVVVTDHSFPNLDIEREYLDSAGITLEVADAATADDVVAAARGADALLTQYAPITAEVLEELDSLSVVGRYGIGVDNVDVEAATSRGVTVLNVPDYCVDEVATHALALLLSCLRKVPSFDTAVESNRWEWSDGRQIHRLSGSVLGLVAFGRIPRRLATMVSGFDLDVVAYDPFCDQETFAEYGVRQVSFETLLAESDFVSIHAPLTDETAGLFDQETFRAMQDSAILVNTSRGPIVDATALGEALESGEIAGAGLDVLPTEPPEAAVLESLESAVLTPHVAWYSEESIVELRETLAADVRNVLNGKGPMNAVNPVE